MAIPLPPATPTPPPDRRPVLDTGQGFLPRVLNRALGRKPAPPHTSDSSETRPPEDKSWAPGDQAECINADSWFTHTPFGWANSIGPECGQVFIVTAVHIAPHPQHGEAIFLTLKGVPSRWEASAFRKLKPVADKAEAADTAFLADLRHRLATAPAEPAEVN